MMEEMMKECCGLEGKPDFEMMKKFMEKCGKKEFSIEEFQMMKDCCAQEGMPDVEKMKELMDKCRCHIPEAAA